MSPVGSTTEHRRSARYARIGTPLTALLAACSAGPAADDLPVVVRDSAGITIVENRLDHMPATCPAAERLRIGTVAGAPEYELYRVFESARVSDGSTALITHNEVRVYGPDGSFRFTFGGTGGGPGEFPGHAVTLDAIRGDTLVVGQQPLRRFSYFDPDGRYLHSVSADPSLTSSNIAAMGVFQDGRVLIGTACCPPTRRLEFVDQDMTLTVMDRASRVDTVGVLPFRQLGLLLDGSEGARPYVETPLFGRRAIAQPAPDGFAYAPSDGPEIQLRSLDGRLRRIIRWSPGPPAVTPEDVDAYGVWMFGGNPGSIFARAAIGPDRPVADTFPAYSAVGVSASGDLWALQHPRPTQMDADRTWLVFDPDGRFRCRVHVPRLQAPKVGPDHIRGVLRDELGVEYVVEYGIGEPEGGR